MSDVLIARQFRGPPNSGNGGYVCGVLGREFDGPSTAILRAIVPLDTPMRFDRAGSGWKVTRLADTGGRGDNVS